MSPIVQGFLGSLLAGLATSLGALPAFFFKGISQKVYHLTLGMAAGIMLSATFFSLLLPALHKGNVFVVSAGLLTGALLIHIVDKKVPHDHFVKGREGPENTRLKGLGLILMSITIHNFHEGIAVALPLRSEGYTPLQAFKWATLTGLVEPVGGLVGASLATFSLIGGFVLMMLLDVLLG